MGKTSVYLERSLGIISSFLTIATVIHSSRKENPSTWWNVVLILTVGFVVAWLIVTLLKRFRPAVPPVASSLNLARLQPPVSYRNAKIEDGRKEEKPLNWPLKLYVVFHNDSSGPIQVGPARWDSKDPQTQTYLNPTMGLGAKFQHAQFDGEKRISWNEDKVLTIPDSATFKVWIGLESAHSQARLERMVDERQLGILTFPINAGGERHQFVCEL